MSSGAECNSSVCLLMIKRLFWL